MHGPAVTRGLKEFMYRIQGSLSSDLSLEGRFPFRFPAAKVSLSFILWFFKSEKLCIFYKNFGHTSWGLLLSVCSS